MVHPALETLQDFYQAGTASRCDRPTGKAAGPRDRLKRGLEVEFLEVK
jgi:hypothetical protein